MKYLAIILLTISSMTIYGQQDTAAKVLGQVTVTATRKQEADLVVPHQVQSINRLKLDTYSPRTTPEALTLLNGVFVQKTNHGGGSPFVRGLTGNQTLILVDGIRLNNATFRYGPNQYLNTIDAFSVNRIEVAKGTGSVQYGTDAIGGVIQVFTKDPAFRSKEHRWEGKALAKYMTGDMEKTVRGEGSYGEEDFAVQIGATYRNFGDLIGGDTTGKQSPSGYKEFAFDSKAKFRLSSTIQLLVANQFVQQTHMPVYHKVVLENFALNEFEPQRRYLSYARLAKQSAQPLFKEMELTVSWQQSTEGRNSLKNGTTALRKEKDQVNTWGLTLDIVSRIGKYWSANSGIELYQDKVGSTREDINTATNTKVAKRGLYPDDAQYGNYSLYTLHHLQFRKWRFDLGARFNTFRIRISDTSLGKVTITPSALVANAAVLYAITPQQSVYASMSSGYRAPNVDDMGTLGIVDFRYEVPTSQLSPEKSYNIELGYKLRTRNFSATANLYYLQLKDLITRVKVDGQMISGYQVYKKENVEESYIRGGELEMDWQVIPGLELTAGASYNYGQNETKKEPLRRVPPFHGRGMVTYRKQQWFGSVEYLFAAKQDRLAQGDKEDNRIPAGGTPGWGVLNIYAGYQLAHFRIGAGLQNLGNKDYRTHGSGINGYGRSAWFQLSYEL